MAVIPSAVWQSLLKSLGPSYRALLLLRDAQHAILIYDPIVPTQGIPSVL
jgi:hypothetical protein